jgi:hypothetical protein
MKKSLYTLSVITIFILLFASACGAAPAAPVSAPAPVENTPTQAPAPTAQVQPATATKESAPTQAFAPACQAASSCVAPKVKEKGPDESVCIEKIPWQNFLVPEGTVFEYQPKAGDPPLYPLICKPTGEKQNGLIFVGCHGAQLQTYNVKITSPSCGSNTLQAGTTSCADGQGYDATNKCCAPLTTGDAGSVIVKVNLGYCHK